MNLTSRSVRAIIDQEMQNAVIASWVSDLAMYVGDSDQDIETYGWLGQNPAMREFLGGRQSKTVNDYSIQIPNKEFEATIEWKLSWFKRANADKIRQRIADFPRRGVTHWNQLLSALILNGASMVCFDGQYFFDTDHVSNDSGVQSNKLSSDVATPTAPTVNEMQSAIMSGLEQIMGFVDDHGEPMNEDAQQFLVMVPPSLMRQAAGALKATVVDNTSNLISAAGALGGFNIGMAVNPRLRSMTDAIHVFRTDSASKPFIRQETGGGVQVSALAEGSDLEFNEKIHRYGLYAERNVGLAFWQHACRVQFV